MSDQANDSLEELFLFGEEKMEKAITQLKREFGQIRSGRANPLILDKVVVDYYGAPTPLRQMSQVTVQDGTTLVITPYDKSILKEIEKAIINVLKKIDIAPNCFCRFLLILLLLLNKLLFWIQKTVSKLNCTIFSKKSKCIFL